MRLEHDLLFTAKLLGRRRERKVGDRFLIIMFMPSMIPSLTLGAGIFCLAAYINKSNLSFTQVYVCWNTHQDLVLVLLSCLVSLVLHSWSRIFPPLFICMLGHKVDS